MTTHAENTAKTGPKPALGEAEASALARMRAVNPGCDPRALLPDVPPSRIPRHIAVIMDGNGRWANQRGLPRAFGHQAGAQAVRLLMESAAAIGVEILTLYSFSSENWKRPREEVDALMALYVHKLRGERDRLVRNNIRLRQIGRREGLPPEVLRELDETIGATAACTGPMLCLAVNYGSRAEIADAARTLAARAARGEIDPASIDEAAIDAALTTAGIPDPDMVLRTAGELRLSNFLLWQASYAEIVVTDVLWPDFSTADLHAAVRQFAGRTRRFGGLEGAPGGGAGE